MRRCQALQDLFHAGQAGIEGDLEQPPPDLFAAVLYAAMAPLFEHYGVQLWMPEIGGRVDYQSAHDEKTMTVLGLSSKREICCSAIGPRFPA